MKNTYATESTAGSRSLTKVFEVIICCMSNGIQSSESLLFSLAAATALIAVILSDPAIRFPAVLLLAKHLMASSVRSRLPLLFEISTASV